MSYVAVVQLMFQVNFTFDIIIYPRRVTICECFYLIRYEITENVQKVPLNNFTWELITLPLKAFSQLKDLIAKFMASILALL